MTGLLGPDGRPISSKDLQNKKAKPPALGERYGTWAGEQASIFNLPGGGAIAFDTSMLQMSDFRQMRKHYQINSSLSVLTFMLHQLEWHLESDDKKLADQLEENLRDVWSRLVRAKSQAFWAGFSPNVLQWENDIDGRAIVLNKIKDLVPEECLVHWKQVKVPGDDTRTFPTYDGISQWGNAKHIPVENSYWYPLLMENGNYYGTRILESAFQPWFFSTLMHLFANRYYERFGEPVPVGRAPYEDEVTVDGKTVKGNVLMGNVLQQIRNRSIAVLPNEKTQFGDETSLDYDYQIEYLESQMRGADFERYMTRLDEEMSLALFTPILMMRTADVGSYNLGTQHDLTYKTLLNAISGDWAQYINKYILRPMAVYNSPRGLNAPQVRIKFMKMGRVQADLLQALISSMVSDGKIKPDIRELGEMAGMSFKEIRTVTAEPKEPGQNDNPDDDTEEDPPAGDEATDSGRGASARAVGREIGNRLEGQVNKAFRADTFGNGFAPSLGYKAQFYQSLSNDGFADVDSRVNQFFGNLTDWMNSAIDVGADMYQDASQFMRLFRAHLDNEMERALR